MQTPVLVQAGLNVEQGGREGDMSSISVDADGSFFAANEYAASDGTWSTAIARFTFAPFTGDGLDITGGNSRVSGLAINGFSGDAIHLSGFGLRHADRR